jgi:hypothetical protein
VATSAASVVPAPEDILAAVLVRKRTAVALIDFEEACLDWRVAGGIVPVVEDDLLVPLIRVRRILEVLRAPYDRHVDSHYQRQNLDAFKRLG